MLPDRSGYADLILLAWQGRLDLPGLIVQAGVLEGQRQFALAAVLYQTWLARNRTTHDQFVYFNLGAALFNENDVEGAKTAYLRALELDPSFVQPHFNLGLVFERLGLREEALVHWRWIADNVSPDRSEFRSILTGALNNIGRVQEGVKEFEDAHSCLSRSLEIDPNQPDALHHWVFMREKLCLWPVYPDLPNVSREVMRESTSALAMLSLTDDPSEQLRAAHNYVRNKLKHAVVCVTPAQPYRHEKIRIAYCSSDFCLHPVALLTAELFELHDRDHFEIYGFCWTKEDGSQIRQRIISAFDHFIRIDSLDDETAAKLIREHEIDILVDLHGQTFGARPGMLSYRPAPIQITYLGLPATTGLPSIDYVIADRFLIPEAYASYYSEKPLYMPDIYQVSDRKRLCLPPPTREQCGLPESAFVFCSFNNNYKFTPEMFSVWMRILSQAPNGVLWLLGDNPWAEQNLREFARQSGVDPARLLFAPRVAPEAYLARFMAADLFLDTFPFNAGTTANDALWAGLPVLTCSGRTFASRMAGALLTAAGLPELICGDFVEYEQRALELASSPAECARLRTHLLEQRASGVLFDTPLFVRNLESAFRRLVDHEIQLPVE